MQFQFQSLTELISMNGHGPYVWACYLFTVLILVVLTYWPLSKKRQVMRQIARQLRIKSNNPNKIMQQTYEYQMEQAVEEAEAAGTGIAVVDGRIVENLHVATARATLAKADAIAAMGG